MAKKKKVDPFSFPFGALAPKRKGKKAGKGKKRKPIGGGS
jgi:hypothetical protein